MIYLNLADISADVFAFWRENDSHEVIYTWDAMLERTTMTYDRLRPQSVFERVVMAMVLYGELEKSGRLN